MDNAYSMSVAEYIEKKNPDIWSGTEAQCADFEEHIFENVWDRFVRHLPTEQDWAHNSVDIWYYADADEILCRNEDDAERIADILDDISGEKMAHTGYYDPEEDEKDDSVDDRTGWYYVDWD